MLFHFSDDPGIALFEPRPVRIPSERGPGRDWLNGPLVWAIDEWHSPMYLFPRDCPRIIVWALPTTSLADRDRWFGGRDHIRMIAHVESSWTERLRSQTIFRYVLPDAPFESLNDAGMHVSRDSVVPIACEPLHDLARALEEAGVELRLMPSLAPLRDVWSTTLHASGIRLRNAAGWSG